MLTQGRPEADDKQATKKPKDDNPNDTDARAEKCQPAEARRLKVAWRSRVTGAHPLSTFMNLETYRMFEYNANLRRYRCFYSHDPEVDLMQFMQCFNVRAVPGVRLHLLDSVSSLFLTPFKDDICDGTSSSVHVVVLGRTQLDMCYHIRWKIHSHHPMHNYRVPLDVRKTQSVPHVGK